MKFSKILYALIVLAICFIIPQKQMFAQNWYGAATYQISFPIGDTEDFTGNTSFRGIGLDFRYTIAKSTTVGITLGWNVFNERTYGSVETGTENPGVVTGTFDRYLNSFPIMANVHYYLGKKGEIRPYAGLNGGVYRMLQRASIGIVTLQNDRWDWGIAPEIGVIIPIDRELAFMVNGKYNYTFTGESVGGADINHSYASLNLGLVWRQ